jgi:hypothetical protein
VGEKQVVAGLQIECILGGSCEWHALGRTSDILECILGGVEFFFRGNLSELVVNVIRYFVFLAKHFTADTLYLIACSENHK